MVSAVTFHLDEQILYIKQMSVYVYVSAFKILFLYKFIYYRYYFQCLGSGVSLGFQILLIAVLTMHYNGDTTKAIAFLFAYLAVICSISSGLIYVFWVCQMNISIVFINKVCN